METKEELELLELGRATRALFYLSNTIEFGDRFDHEDGFLCYARDEYELLKWYYDHKEKQEER